MNNGISIKITYSLAVEAGFFGVEDPVNTTQANMRLELSKLFR